MTGNGPTDIHPPGSAPSPDPSPPRNAASRPLSPRNVAHRSSSGPLSLRERVRVRAPHHPARFEHNRTGPNNCTPESMHSNQPTPSKTDHPQPFFPRKTLDFRLIRPSEKFSANHLPPTAASLPPPSFEPRAGSQADSTLSNTAERRRTASSVKPCTQTDKTGPKLSNIDHPQSPIPRKTLEILPFGPRRKKLSPDTRSSTNPLVPNSAPASELRGVS